MPRFDTTARRGATLAAGLLTALCATHAAGAPEGLDEMRGFARELMAQERYPDALAVYVTITEHAASDPRAHYEYAATLAFLRMYPEAVAPIERAIALEPDNTLYLELAAMTYQNLRRYDEAFAATRRGAEAGDVKAMYGLAGMYEHGRGITASDADALAWLRRAAEAGHLGAMDAMSRVYRDGLYGQPRDASRAARWSRRLEAELAR
jgi:TPR repeat protein